MKKASNIPTWNYPSSGTPIYRDTTDAPPNVFRQGGFMGAPPETPPKDYSTVPGVNKEKLEQWNSLGKQEPSNVQEAQLLAEAVGYTPHQAIIVAAQWALESGQGKKVGGDYNYFGIKSHNEAVRKRMADMYGLNLSANEAVATSEYEGGQKKATKDSFMNFENPVEAFLGHKAFLESNARYNKALTETTSPAEFAQALQEAGYATSPTYSESLGKIAKPVIGKEAYGTATTTTTPSAPTRPKTFDSVLYSGEVAQANAGVKEYYNTMAGFNKPFEELVNIELPSKKNLPAMSLKPGSTNFGQSIFTAGRTFNPPKTNSKEYGGAIGVNPEEPTLSVSSIFSDISKKVDINPKWENQFFHYNANKGEVNKTIGDRFKNFQDKVFNKYSDLPEYRKITTRFSLGGIIGDPPPNKNATFIPSAGNNVDYLFLKDSGYAAGSRQLQRQMQEPTQSVKQTRTDNWTWSPSLNMYVNNPKKELINTTTNYKDGGTMGDPPPKNSFLPTSSSFDPAALNRIYQDVKEQEEMKTQYLPEQQIYATPESRKKYEDVYAKAQSVVKTFPRVAEHFKQNKRYKDQGIEGVSEYIKDITGYQKDAEKYYKARQAVKKGRMSTEDFERAYRERGWQQFDNKNVKTSEKDQKELEETWYGQTDEEGRRYWMSNPMNVGKVAQGTAAAAVLGPGALASGVAAPLGYLGRGALKTLANPWVSTPLSGYGIYDAVANTIPDAVKAFDEGRTWDGIGNTALATADLALPFIPWGKVAPKLLPGATSEFAGDIAKIKKDINSVTELTKNVTSFPGSTFDIIRGLRNFPEYKKLNKKLNIAESEFATKSKEIDDEVKLKLIPEREKLKKELNNIAVKYKTKSLVGKERIKLQQKEKELTNKINSLDELIQAKEKGLIKVVDNYNLKIEKELSIFKDTGSMKTELSDGKNYITDFETGEQVPFNINIPKAETKLGVQPRTTVNEKFYPFTTSGDKVITTKTEALESNYSMGEAAKNTMIKNIEYVKQRFPGSVEFGSSTFAKLGIPHATDDIDLITTRKAFNEIEKLGYKQTSGTQARYGKTYDLEGKTKIDVNVIEEGKDGMATGELASELYRLYYPDEFYSEMSRLVIKSAKTNKTPNVSEVKIHVSPEELLAKVQENPAIKTLVDAFEAGASSPLKAKHLNRTDYILETAQDTETVKKAQEAWIKSVAGTKGNIGFQFPKEQLVDLSSGVSAFNSVKRNKEILSKINITEDLGYNVSNIASNSDRMQLFLNDYYMNSALFSRNIELDTFKEVLKKEGVEVNLENLQDTFITWKKGKTGSASAMGYGINFLEYGNPSFGSVSGDVFYNLIHNKNYSNPLEYIDDIERQVKASYVFNKPEKNIIKELADKYSIEIKGNLNTLSKWNLIDKSTVPKGDFIEGMTKNQTKEYDKLTSFYKEVGETLGMKAVTRVDKDASFGNSFYSSGLGNIDKELDAINISLKKLESDKFGQFNPIPVQKSRRSRQENLERTIRIDRSTEIENQVLYNLKNIDLKIGAINNYNETVKKGLLDKQAALLKELEKNQKTLQEKVYKSTRSKEIRGENPKVFKGSPIYKSIDHKDVLRIEGYKYDKSQDRLVHTMGSKGGNVYLGNDEKRYLNGELGKIDKQIGDFELEIEKYANKIKEVKELQAPIERFFSDDAINSFAWLSVSAALGLGTTMGLINEFSSNEPSGNRKIKLPTDEEFHNENETNPIWMPTKETPYGYNEGEWRKQKTKNSFVQLPNGTWVKRTFTDVGKTEVKKLGGKLNTLTKSQNTLPLQSITEAQEIELTPEEAKYYESLGYKIEELD